MDIKNAETTLIATVYNIFSLSSVVVIVQLHQEDY